MRSSGARSSLAGFALGVIAVSTGVLFARPAADAPLNEAARHAEQVAAMHLVAEPGATPAAAPPQRISFVDDGGASTLFSQRHATRLVISSIGLDAEVAPVGLVYRGGALQYDVPVREAGQYAGTAAPGDDGNVVIGGHVARSGAPGVFAALPDVAAGDVVEVFRGADVFRYFITEIRVVAADATDVMGPTQEATLTLITCFPDDHYAERLVVVGRLL